MKYTPLIALVLSVAAVVWLAADKFNGSNVKKTGVVQMEKLIYDFNGMKEATKQYTAKMDKWQRRTDSLENKLKDLYDQLRLDSLSKNKVRIERAAQNFLLFRQSYAEYGQSVREMAENEDRQMTLGVINQMNEYIKQFAEKKGYDVIFCNNHEQTVGYAKEQIDVTQELLEFANNEYAGAK